MQSADRWLGATPRGRGPACENTQGPTPAPSSQLGGSLVFSILGYVRLICRSGSRGRPGGLASAKASAASRSGRSWLRRCAGRPAGLGADPRANLEAVTGRNRYKVCRPHRSKFSARCPIGTAAASLVGWRISGLFDQAGPDVLQGRERGIARSSLNLGDVLRGYHSIFKGLISVRSVVRVYLARISQTNRAASASGGC